MVKKKVIFGYQVRNKNNDGIRYYSSSLTDCIKYCPFGCAVWSTVKRTYGIKLRFFWMSPFKKIGYDKYSNVVNFFHLHVGWEVMKGEVPVEIVYEPKNEQKKRIDMVEFNFKSQRATTIEQSERLIALGLRKETADMTHHYLHSTDSYELKDIEFSRVMHLQELVNKKPVLGKSGDDLYAKDIPAWGLHRLSEILDTNPFVFYINCGYDNVIDRVEKYIEEGLIDTRYLEEWCLNEEE